MAAHGGQFCASVLVPYAVLYVSFSLPRDILHFPKEFSVKKFRQNSSSKDRNEYKNFKWISTKSNELQVMYFDENKLPNYRETW